MTRFGWPKRRPPDDDLQDEIRAHLAIAAGERVAEGADERSARLASLKEFGNVALTTEAVRSVWTPWWAAELRDLASDVRYACRTLAKHPGFSLTVIVILTLGIGLNAAVFTLLKSLALTPIAGVERSGSLGVVLNETSAGRRVALSYPDFRDIRDHDRAFVRLFGTATTNLSLGVGQRAERIMGELVTGDYFQELGVRAQLGRVLLPSDEVAPGQHPVVVLSDALWRRQFASDPNIVGTTVRLNTYPLTVVGVAEASFHGSIVSFDVDAFIPIAMAAEVRMGDAGESQTLLSNRERPFVIAMGRLRPGVTLADASSQMAVLSTRLRELAPPDAMFLRLAAVPIWQSPFGAQTYMLPAVIVLSVTGALLLLIVSTNLSGLVLARCLSRRGEIALRLALGASRGRILRLLLVENIVLAAPAAIAALALVPMVLPLFLSAVSASAPVRLFFNLSVDWLVIAFSAAAAVASASAFGLVPALRSAWVDLLAVMKEDLLAKGAVKGRVRMGLVVSQVAVSMTLLVAAGLVERSVDAARSADYGFDAAGVVSARLDLRPNGYDEARGLAFYTELLGAVRASAGIESATLANATPLTLVDDGARKVTVEGYEPRTGEDMTFLSNIVAPDYFHTLKIGVLAGREFTRPDDAGAMPVAIVNGTLAERFWGGASQAIGKRLQVQAGEWRTVVGVVRDIKYSRINEARRPYVYLPFLQFYDPMMLVHARGSVGTAALLDTLRRQVQTRDPELPILGARTLTEQTQSALAFLDMAAGVLFTFGIAGIALAALGIYGLISYSVAQSAQEIGIRMALGARPSEVVWHYLRRGLRLGAIGAVVGTVAALASTRVLGSLLYGISTTDLVSFAVALAVVLGTVSVASVIPAWRAARSGPMAALLRG